MKDLVRKRPQKERKVPVVKRPGQNKKHREKVFIDGMTFKDVWLKEGEWVSQGFHIDDNRLLLTRCESKAILDAFMSDFPSDDKIMHRADGVYFVLHDVPDDLKSFNLLDLL